MKKPTFIKARVCTRIDDETVCTTKEKKIVLAMVEEDKGTMLDGREVIKVDNWWYYIPSRGTETAPWRHDDGPPRQPSPPVPPITKTEEKPKPDESKNE